MPQFTRLEVFYKTNVTIYNCEHTELRQVFGTKHTVVSYRFGRTRHEQSPATCAKELSINFSLPNYSHTNSKHSETIFSPTHHTTRDLVHENVVSSYHSSVHVTPAWGRIPHGFSIAWTSLSVSGEEFNVCLLWEFWSKGTQHQPISGKEEKNTLGPADWPELRPALPTRQGNVLSTTTPRNHHDCQGYDHNAPYCIAPSRPFPKQNLENTWRGSWVLYKGPP